MLEPVTTSQDVSSDQDVIGQIKLAFSNPLPLIIGALIGALVPLATYTVGHDELAKAGWASVAGAIVIGGCIFSAITVYKWGQRAFGCDFKAAGFVVLSEGVMTFSTTAWLSVLVLCFLVAINAVANGANLTVAHLAAKARHAALIASVQDAIVAATPAVTPVLVASVSPVTPLGSEPAVVSAGESAVDGVQQETRPVVVTRRRASTKVKVTKSRAPRRTTTSSQDLN